MSADGAAIQPTPTLSLDDQRRLLEFLRALRGGKTKVVITSRSSEEWLEPATCFRFAIGGLQGEERWEYCDAVVRDLGLTVDRTNTDWVNLMDLLDGHPLAMRVILSHLQTSSVAQLMASLKTNLLQFAGQDVESAKLFATLRFVQDGLSVDLQRLLIPLALHDRFVDADYLKVMGKQVNEPVPETDVDRLTRTLSTAGLLSDRGQAMFEMHPALSRYLQSTLLRDVSADEYETWCRAFIDFMARLADHFAQKELHEQRGVFHIHGTNFRRALKEAERLGMDQPMAALTQSLAAFAQNTRNFQDATNLFLRLAESRKRVGDHEVEAAAYHQLGRIAGEQRDFAAAEQWSRKSLAIEEKQGNEHGAAGSYHQLGRIAQEQGQHEEAGRWSIKAIRVFQRSDAHNAGIAVNGFMTAYNAADETIKGRLRAKWSEANLGAFPAT